MGADPAILLDVSRLVSRIGTGPLTGIDRVEAAWLSHLAGRDHLLLCRVSRGQLLLPPEAGPAILRWIEGDMAGLPARPGWRERLARRSGPVACAMTDLRRMAIASAGRSGTGLAEVARRHLPEGAAYLNVGHANLDRRLLAGLKGFRRVVMIHDTIPLDHPEYTRDGQSERFRTRFMTAMSLADQIVAISDATAAQIELWRGRLGVTHRAPIVTAHIGTVLTPADPGAIPTDFDLSRPFFLSLGTIEPRKNHALLLDIWQDFCRAMPPEDVPELHIIGRRGWNNSDVFRVLDRDPMINRAVFEHNSLSDAAVRAHIAQSWGLLFPSHTEGFGLPLIEAAAFGVPIFCGENAIYHEILGDYPLYLSLSDPYPWQQGILGRAGRKRESEADRRMRAETVKLPDWKTHFDRIFRFV